jgi:hypothetical protein
MTPDYSAEAIMAAREEWRRERMAMPTASQFARILTTANRKYAAAAEGYRAELLAEWMLGGPLEGHGAGGFADRGTEMEDEAREWYEFAREVEVNKPGFVKRADGRVGGSPDGLVGEDGLIEIKCLGAKGHVMALLDPNPETDYWGQMQGYLYLTGRDWCDLVLYHPTFPRRVVRVERDEAYQVQLHRALARFLRELDQGKRDLVAAGWHTDEVLPPADEDPEALIARMYGVEPSADIMTEDEMEQMGKDLSKAAHVSPERRREITGAVIAGDWTEARKGWAEARETQP